MLRQGPEGSEIGGGFPGDVKLCLGLSPRVSQRKENMAKPQLEIEKQVDRIEQGLREMTELLRERDSLGADEAERIQNILDGILDDE